jgi:hypothetical protein
MWPNASGNPIASNQISVDCCTVALKGLGRRVQDGVITRLVGKSRRDNHVEQKKTAKSRFRRALARIKEWGREHRHLTLREQWRKLNEKLRGHDAYYGVTGNYRQKPHFSRTWHHSMGS